MYHLFNSRVRVERLQLIVVDGRPEMQWAQATDPDPVADEMLQRLPCRIDTDFVRPGKDQPPAYEAGKAQDRVALFFTFPYAPIRAGDHFIAIENDHGKIPVPGTWDLRNIPDTPQDFADQHHIEVQVVEINQNLNEENWPSEEPLP